MNAPNFPRNSGDIRVQCVLLDFCQEPGNALIVQGTVEI